MLRLLCVLVSACAVAAAPQAPPPSVHDQLADPVRFKLSGTGSIDAEHRLAADTWVGGGAHITIADGVLVARLDGDRLVVDTFDISLDPVALPETVFGQPASLSGVRVTLASPSSAEPTWPTPDTTTAVLDLTLDLAWAITIAGATTPLGVQQLPTMSMAVKLSATDSGLDASLGLHGAGELWRWANLIRLSDFELVLAATSQELASPR